MHYASFNRGPPGAIIVEARIIEFVTKPALRFALYRIDQRKFHTPAFMDHDKQDA